MATTQIKNGYQGGSDDQLLVNTDGSINVNVSATVFNQIMSAQDLVLSFTYADAGLATQRVIEIDGTSATVHPTNTAKQVFSYTLTSGQYVLTTVTRSVV